MSTCSPPPVTRITRPFRLIRNGIPQASCRPRPYCRTSHANLFHQLPAIRPTGQFRYLPISTDFTDAPKLRSAVCGRCAIISPFLTCAEDNVHWPATQQGKHRADIHSTQITQSKYTPFLSGMQHRNYGARLESQCDIVKRLSHIRGWTRIFGEHRCEDIGRPAM